MEGAVLNLALQPDYLIVTQQSLAPFMQALSDLHKRSEATHKSILDQNTKFLRKQEQKSMNCAL